MGAATHLAAVPLAAPPGGVVSPVAVGVIGTALGALVVVNLLIAWGSRRKRRQVPVGQLRDELRGEIRNGAPNARGLIRVNPARYPGISVGEAEAVAAEEGFTRQTHGTKGMWLFLRRVSD
ncbi:hypothetical protein ACFZBZ_34735 [Streptomyces sp. NPDC008196]|uniref:hypothetical protein n=1 Tax=Streptomyces sp. NPDC008196 TaxID=3364819 RepID=UPI0036EEAB0B